MPTLPRHLVQTSTSAIRHRASALAVALLGLAACATGCGEPAASRPTPVPNVLEAVAIAPTDQPDRLAEPAGLLPRGAVIRSVCIRPQRQDVVFSVLLDHRLFLAPFDAEGVIGEVSQLADMRSLAGDAAMAVDWVQCAPNDDRILVTLTNPHRMTGDVSWFAELWLLDGDGVPMFDHALARDVGPETAVWSPDGSALLLEASRFDEAGAVHVLDLATGTTERLEGTFIVGPAGHGGGGAGLHWTHDGQMAIAESLVLEADGSTSRVLEVLTRTDAGLRSSGKRELPGALAVAADPSGGVVVISAGTGAEGDVPRLTAWRWDPAEPDGDLVPLGELGDDVPADAFVRELSVHPRPDLGDGAVELVFLASVQEVLPTTVFRAVPGAPESAAVERVSEPEREVGGLDVAGDWLVYRVAELQAADAETPPGVTDQLRVVPLHSPAAAPDAGQ